MFEHEKLDEVLEEVRVQKLQGKTLVAISHELARKFLPPPGKGQRGNGSHHNWDTSHVISCLDVLRKRGDLPPSGLQIEKVGRRQYHDFLEKISKERRLLRPNR